MHEKSNCKEQDDAYRYYVRNIKEEHVEADTHSISLAKHLPKGAGHFNLGELSYFSVSEDSSSSCE